jgi:RNA polymerase sigma factor (sigma-70 family)
LARASALAYRSVKCASRRKTADELTCPKIPLAIPRASRDLKDTANPTVSASSKSSALEPSAADSQTRWFAEEVHPHDSSLKAYLRRAFPTVHDVDDVVQESYLRVWKRHAARPIESVKSFLFTVAKHVALGSLRRAKRSPISDVTDFAAGRIIDDSPDAAEMVCTREEIEILFAAVSTLSARTRDVYLLRKFEALSQQEIATRLGIAPHTVEVHIGRANRHCATFLRRHGVLRAS